MTIADFIRQTSLDDSLLLGYYGGGNYGDELLLEVLQNMLARQNVKRVSIAYQQPDNFARLHHDFGYHPFNLRNKMALIKASLASKCIVVGGGGLWGVDMNLNTFQMSVYLWLCRWLFGKKVYLLGVGYYRSTSRLGHLGARFAAAAANRIFTRDRESHRNFQRLAKHKTDLDQDIAWYIADLPLGAYQKAAQQLGRELGLRERTLVLATRRPQAAKQRRAFARYNKLIEHYIANNPDTPIILAPLEFSRTPDGALGIASPMSSKTHVRTLGPATNPLTVYMLFKLYHDQLILAGPQFHIMLTAYLTHVPFLPICYDNKVHELFDRIGVPRAQQLAVEGVTASSLKHFMERPKTE